MRTQLLLRWLACFAVSFFVVYLLAFATGNQLFESSNSALVGVSGALMLGSLAFGTNERNRAKDAKIKELEERIAKLEGNK